MKYFIAKCTISTVGAISPVNLLRLADSMGEKTDIDSPPIIDDINNGELPRSIDDIMTDIKNKKFNNITLIEWIYCFFNKVDWDQKNLSLESSSADLVWQGALKNKPAKYRLFWLLAIAYIDPDKSLLSPSIVRAFNNPNSVKNKALDDIVAIKILRYLKDQNSYKSIADLCFTNHENPDKLLSSNNLPWNIKIGEEYTLAEAISLKLPESFSRLKEQKETDFSILFDKLTSIRGKYQVEFVENILKHILPEKGSQFTELADWLKKHYGIASIGSGWNKLSHDAKLALRKWIGAINFKDFENLSNAILKLIKLESYERNRIETRKYFWSNYTDRFERIRILLPNRIFQILSVNNYNMENIELLKPDGSRESEVCIFDFSPFIIVEFFRGNGSETIIFDKRETYMDKEKEIDIGKLLFESDLSAKRIRGIQISIENIHDHVFCWQNSCEELLRKKGILPNPDLQRFIITPTRRPFYKQSKGLPAISQEDLEKRERKLYYWRKEIHYLHIESMSYVQENEVDLTCYDEIDFDDLFKS